METIIGLLFVLLPVIFKFIEKKLQDSEQNVQTKEGTEFVDIFDESDDDENFEFPFESEPVIFQPVAPVLPVTPVKERKEVDFNAARLEMEKPLIHKTVNKSSPILMEEKQIKKKTEKIDPKKLVVYSEIMKPKYQD